mgnify:CR=1 FL=1
MFFGEDSIFKKDLYFLFSSIVNELKKIQKKVDYDKLYLELDNYKKDYIKTKKKIGKYFEHYHNGVIKLKNKINC